MSNPFLRHWNFGSGFPSVETENVTLLLANATCVAGWVMIETGLGEARR